MAGIRTKEHADKVSAAMLRRNADRIRWQVVDVGYETPCWLWSLSLNERGYPMISVTSRGAKKTYRAHRFYYEQQHGPIPAGLTLDHLCCQRACVNPDHLEPVTQKENVQRGLRRRAEAGLPRYGTRTEVCG